MAVKNHIIAGVSGDDLDVPGYIQAHDPVTGEMQWRWYTVPMKAGDFGAETWPSLEAAQHGGGMTWQPVTYDPDLNQIYVVTGNPQLTPLLAEAAPAVVGADWRAQLEDAWQMAGHDRAIQGNLDPTALLADRNEIRRDRILRRLSMPVVG